MWGQQVTQHPTAGPLKGCAGTIEWALQCVAQVIELDCLQDLKQKLEASAAQLADEQKKRKAAEDYLALEIEARNKAEMGSVLNMKKKEQAEKALAEEKTLHQQVVKVHRLLGVCQFKISVKCNSDYNMCCIVQDQEASDVGHTVWSYFAPSFRPNILARPVLTCHATCTLPSSCIDAFCNPQDTYPPPCCLLQNAVVAEETLKGKVKEAEAQLQKIAVDMTQLQQAHQKAIKVSFSCSSWSQECKFHSSLQAVILQD